MSGREPVFSPEDQAKLRQNPNVLKVSEAVITYSPDFKARAVRANAEGKPASLIFRDAGLDRELVGLRTPERCLERWRKIFAERGEQGLRDDRRGKGAKGRPPVKDLTVEDKLRRSEARVRYLEKEVEFLKKLDAIERAWLASHPKSTR